MEHLRQGWIRSQILKEVCHHKPVSLVLPKGHPERSLSQKGQHRAEQLMWDPPQFSPQEVGHTTTTSAFPVFPLKCFFMALCIMY